MPAPALCLYSWRTEFGHGDWRPELNLSFLSVQIWIQIYLNLNVPGFQKIPPLKA
jgi:hypothetical protein